MRFVLGLSWDRFEASSARNSEVPGFLSGNLKVWPFSSDLKWLARLALPSMFSLCLNYSFKINGSYSSVGSVLGEGMLSSVICIKALSGEPFSDLTEGCSSLLLTCNRAFLRGLPGGRPWFGRSRGFRARLNLTATVGILSLVSDFAFGD